MDALSPVTEVIADISGIRAAEADDSAGLLAAAKQAWADVEENLEARFLAGGSAFEAMEARSIAQDAIISCLLYTSPSPRDRTRSRMPSSA